jgi:hypothetical protein
MQQREEFAMMRKVAGALKFCREVFSFGNGAHLLRRQMIGGNESALILNQSHLGCHYSLTIPFSLAMRLGIISVFPSNVLPVFGIQNNDVFHPFGIAPFGVIG